MYMYYIMLSKEASLEKLRIASRHEEDGGYGKAPALKNCNFTNISSLQFGEYVSDYEIIDLTDLRFNNCNFTNSDFSDHDLQRCEFSNGCILNNTKFKKTDLRDVKFGDVNLYGIDINGAKVYSGTTFSPKAYNSIKDKMVVEAIKSAKIIASKVGWAYVEVLKQPSPKQPSTKQPSPKEKLWPMFRTTVTKKKPEAKSVTENKAAKKTDGSKNKSKRCQNGTRRNKKTGNCEKK